MAISQELENVLASRIGTAASAVEVSALLNAISALSGTEAGYLDAVTPGTAAASKVLVLDANKAIRIGAWAASGAAGNAVALSTALDIDTQGQVDVLSVFGASTADMGSGYSAKVGRFRHLATVSVAHETYGLIGQMVTKGSTLSHLHAGLMGTFEGQTATVLSSSYSVGHAGVTARVGGHASITATTPIAGFLAFNNAGAALASGISAAFAASAYSASYPWSVGLYMPVGSVNQGIRIGHWKTAGGTGNAIPISAATDSADTTQRNIVACYGESTTDLGVGIHANVGRFRHLVAGSSLQVNHETYGLVGQLVGRSTSLLHMHAGLMGTLEASTTAVVANGAYAYSVAAVIARIGGGALITASKPVCGFSAVLNGAAISASGVSIAYGAMGTSTGTWTALLGADKCDAILYVATGTNYECGIKALAKKLDAANTTYCIKISIAGTPAYIPAFGSEWNA